MQEHDQTEADSVEEVTENTQETPPELLWISEGSNTVLSTIYIYTDKDTKRLRTILTQPSPDLRLQGMPEFVVETMWSVPTRVQMDGYRESASRYNVAARAVLVQRGLMEDLIIKNHLLELKTGSEGNWTQVELVRDKKGKLTSVSMETLNKLHPSVMEMIFAKFLDEAALII
jgi:hypothetical protein